MDSNTQRRSSDAYSIAGQSCRFAYYGDITTPVLDLGLLLQMVCGWDANSLVYTGDSNSFAISGRKGYRVYTITFSATSFSEPAEGLPDMHKAQYNRAYIAITDVKSLHQATFACAVPPNLMYNFDTDCWGIRVDGIPQWDDINNEDLVPLIEELVVPIKRYIEVTIP